MSAFKVVVLFAFVIGLAVPLLGALAESAHALSKCSQAWSDGAQGLKKKAAHLKEGWELVDDNPEEGMRLFIAADSVFGDRGRLPEYNCGGEDFLSQKEIASMSAEYDRLTSLARCAQAYARSVKTQAEAKSALALALQYPVLDSVSDAKAKAATHKRALQEILIPERCELMPQIQEHAQERLDTLEAVIALLKERQTSLIRGQVKIESELQNQHAARDAEASRPERRGRDERKTKGESKEGGGTGGTAERAGAPGADPGVSTSVPAPAPALADDPAETLQRLINGPAGRVPWGSWLRHQHLEFEGCSWTLTIQDCQDETRAKCREKYLVHADLRQSLGGVGPVQFLKSPGEGEGPTGIVDVQVTMLPEGVVNHRGEHSNLSLVMREDETMKVAVALLHQVVRRCRVTK